MKKSKKDKPNSKPQKKKETPTKLNMTFEQAIQMSFAPKIKPKKMDQALTHLHIY